ncbi:MAG: hypothetical protein GXP42_07305 [Chloroflexi bacterium]|nr:hypothetical protein [Chloroflexota bacterium]
MVRAHRRIYLLFIVFALLLFLCVATGAEVAQRFKRSSPTQTAAERLVEAYRFDLLRYEISAIAEKGVDLTRRLGSRLTPAEQQRLVTEYNRRANELSQLEREITRIYADPNIADPAAASAELRRKQTNMRALQRDVQSLVEAILEKQVTDALAQLNLTTAGMVWPPVRFTFDDLPDFLIVSPRERIELEAGVHLRGDLDMAQIESIEDAVAQALNRSTLVESLGGLGVWPTLVSDEASLAWILSTIAHEWVHTYLVFFPLGQNMFDSAEMNTINETVADIVGDEVGWRVATEIYGLDVPPPEPPPPPDLTPPPPDPDVFDFRTEMRRTRLRVDDLLAEGRVEEAEQYMEMRRREFVANGYPIRKLNQAYFAFHGSYATTAASSDPIGPKLWELRERTPDLATFLRDARSIREPADLDALLEERAQ